MRVHLITGTFLLAATQVLAAPPAISPPSTEPTRNAQCEANWNALSFDDKSRLSYAAFTQNCENDLAGNPEPLRASTGAMPLADVTGLCRDSTYTSGHKRATACARHGGIQMWFAGAR